MSKRNTLLLLTFVVSGFFSLQLHAYKVDVRPGGGLVVNISGEKYAVESWYSFPNRGFNKMLPAKIPCAKGEKSWTIKVKKINDQKYNITAEGDYYKIDRLILLKKNKIEIKDQITNKTNKLLGIMLRNQVNISPGKLKKGYTNGNPEVKESSYAGNPTVFVSRDTRGLGIMAVDDVYRLQSKAYYFKKYGLAGMRTDNFGLNPKETYTVKCDIYPIESNDYFDFINTVRKDIGSNSKIDGLWSGTMYYKINNGKYSITAPDYTPATDENIKNWIKLRGVKYVCSPLSGAVRNSFDTIWADKKKQDELRQFCTRMKKLSSETKILTYTHPIIGGDIKRISTYADSLAKSNGKHIIWNYGEQEKFPLFIPTLTNSWGKMILETVKLIVNDLGCDGIYLDEWAGGVCGWSKGIAWGRPGHTVRIDLKTFQPTMQGEYAPIIIQPFLKEIAKYLFINNKSFVVNGPPLTEYQQKFFIKYKMRNFRETGMTAEIERNRCRDTQLYSPVVLSPAKTYNRKQYAQAIRDGLEEGVMLDYYNLYHYLYKGNDSEYWLYGRGCDKILENPLMTTYMAPITIKELHSGYIIGEKKIITIKSRRFLLPGNADSYELMLFDQDSYLVKKEKIPASLISGTGKNKYFTLKLPENYGAIIKALSAKNINQKQKR
jgi:hypothetical protein